MPKQEVGMTKFGRRKFYCGCDYNKEHTYRAWLTANLWEVKGIQGDVVMTGKKCLVCNLYKWAFRNSKAKKIWYDTVKELNKE
jgi:hypothetical protein